MNFNKSKKWSVLLLALSSSPIMGGGGAFAAPETSRVERIQDQTITLHGTVVDEKEEPIMGATVRVVSQKNKGMITDLNGKFTLSGIKKGDKIEVSYIGYKTFGYTVTGEKTLQVKMEPNDQLLQEVVVVGYGTQKKVNLTGAVSSVDAKTLEARPVQNVSQALQGAVPGLNLTVGNAGGQLDGRLNISIRGAGTIGEGSYSGPLVLIDGTEGDMNSLSPNDIESISVLKDASSSAIYGSRAAFGVILITTKSGKEGRNHLSYNGSFRFSTATQVPRMMDSYTFAKYWNTAAANIGGQAIFSDDVLEKIKAFQQSHDPSDVGTEWNPQRRNWKRYDEGSWANTDWFKELYRSNAPSQEHNIALSGGTQKFNYYLSGAVLTQEGLIRYGRDNFQRYNFNGKISSQVTPWFNITYNHKWSREDFDRPSYLTGLFFHNIARRWPNNALKDPNGFFIEGNEVIQLLDGGRDNSQTDRSMQQLVLQFDPIKDWKIRLEGNYNITVKNNHWEVLPIFYHNKEKVEVASKWDDGKPEGYSDVFENAEKSNYFNGRFYTEYSKQIQKHNFKGIAGMDMELSKWRNVAGDKKTLITPTVPTINTASDDKPNLSGGYSHWATAGMFARLNYNYDERYLAELSIRRDGSSRFVGDKTWGTFPSFSLGWNIANEAFWSPLRSTVSILKLRGSWGALGNTNIQALYPWFQSQPVEVAKGNWLVEGKKPTISRSPGIVSQSLTWERVTSWNAGLDFALFRNRLQGSFEVFNRYTYDMVGPSKPLPSILGTAQPALNNTDMLSRGWEVELKWRDEVNGFKYGIRGVLSDDKQIVTRYYNPTGTLSTWYEGRTNGEIWGYTTVGIAKTDEEMTAHLEKNKPSWGSDWLAGDVMYADLNGDGIVNAGANTLEDHGDLTIIGNSMPHYRFGINLDAEYKGIDFAMFLQGVGRRDFWDNSPYSVGANHGMWQSAAFKEHWDFFRPSDDPNGANPDAFYPRPLFNKGGKNFMTQTRYLQQAAYMRIKNVQLGYTLPKSISERLYMNRLRLYVSADNLYTFTKLNKVFDPEATSGGWGAGKIYPLSRVVSFGVNVNF